MIPNPFSGKFIAFEGIDGCGKTTQVRKVEDWIRRDLKLAVTTTKEPDKKGFWGQSIYTELHKPYGLWKTDPFGFQTWYACDSKENLRNVVIPRLRADCVVLSDRFRPSLCYGAQTEEKIYSLMAMNERIIGEDFIWPDAVLIFDVTPEIAVARLKNKDARLDEHEKIEILKRVRNNYLFFICMCDYKNCFLINAERSPEEVFDLVKRVLDPLLLF